MYRLNLILSPRRIIRRFVWKRPVLYAPIALSKHRRDVIPAGCDLFIDGFPRSANTFTSLYWQQTQPHLKIRSHDHIPPFIIAALKKDIPALLLIRNPLDAVSSYAILVKTSFEQELCYYIDYYDALLAYREQMFIVDFENAVAHPRQVLYACARHYKLGYRQDFDEAVVLDQIKQKIEQRNTREDGTIDHDRLNIPSEHRTNKKKQILANAEYLFNSPNARRAQALYKLYLETRTHFVANPHENRQARWA